MTVDNDDERFSEETDSDRRGEVLADNALSVELASAFSGDRALTEAEKDFFTELEKTRGQELYSDLFYAITHEYFAPKIAEALWTEVLRLARNSDICARYGGEEFAVLLPITDSHEAGEIAEGMRIQLAQLQLSDGRTVTVSIGVASCGKKTLTFQELVEKADAALYRAKRKGKNRVVLNAEDEVRADANRTEPDDT